VTTFFYRNPPDTVRAGGNSQHWNCREWIWRGLVNTRMSHLPHFVKTQAGKEIVLPTLTEHLGTLTMCQTCSFQIHCLALSHTSLRRDDIPSHSLNMKALKRGENPHKRGGGL
jgi:hypothetical protein